MSDAPIRFDDGAAYERMMGRWSRLAGDVFIDWLALPAGLRWLDVGCGNGAFTEAIAVRCSPASVDGIDPSEGQLAFARTRPATAGVRYRQGDAMTLPYGDDAFDVALMALVIFFVPDPPKAVAEMARVVRTGGTIAAYAWDMHGGGFPHAALAAVLRDRGTPPPKPPSVDASKLDAMIALWEGAGIGAIETRQITVRRTFADFDELWSATRATSSLSAIIDKEPAAAVESIRDALRERLHADADGSVTVSARANAVKGKLPR